MQYHCVLLDTCIGHRNLHYYIRALGFACAAAVYTGVAAGSTLRDEIMPALRAAAAASASPPEQVAANAANAGLSGIAAQLAAAAAAAAAEAQAAAPASAAAATPFPWTTAAMRAAAATPATRTLVLLVAVCAATLLVALPLLISHVARLRRGLTYIESCKVPRTSEYDLGGGANCRAVFGDGGFVLWLLHLFPLPRAAVGDGLSFACRPPARRV